MKKHKLKTPVFITCLTEESWVKYIFDIMVSTMRNEVDNIEEIRQVSMDEFLGVTFGDTHIAYNGLFMAGVMLVPPEKIESVMSYPDMVGWSYDTLQKVYPTLENLKYYDSEHKEFLSYISEMVRFLGEFFKNGHRVTSVTLELPDVVYVTVQ